MPADFMIRTEFRSKLANAFSYPIGAEVLSHGLNGVPQLSSLSISFRSSPDVSASAFRRLILEGRPYPIIRARFTRWDKRPSVGDDGWAQEYLAGVWRLEVFPVPRGIKAIARRHLLDTGIPAVRSWLAAPRAPSWYYGRKRCDVMFSPDEATIAVTESVDAA
jgi:hypothetical protein